MVSILEEKGVVESITIDRKVDSPAFESVRTASGFKGDPGSVLECDLDGLHVAREGPDGEADPLIREGLGVPPVVRVVKQGGPEDPTIASASLRGRRKLLARAGTLNGGEICSLERES